MLYVSYYDSPIGRNYAWSTGGCDICQVHGFEGQKYYMDKIIEDFEEKKDLPVLDQAGVLAGSVFCGGRIRIRKNFLLQPAGRGDFRKEVWKIIAKSHMDVPLLVERSQRSLAVKTGREKYPPQAVGGAVGHNPISVIIPCHRVIGSDGSLTGYAGGLEKKEWLLAIEEAHIR